MPNRLKIVIFLLIVVLLSTIYGFLVDFNNFSVSDVLYLILPIILIVGLIKKSEAARRILLLLTWVMSFLCVVVLILLFVPEKNILKAFSGTERLLTAVLLICFSMIYTIINKYMRSDEILQYYKKST